MDNDDLVQRFLKAFKALPVHEQIATTLRLEREVHEEALNPNNTLPISERNNG